jgi:hypothetical protein
MCVDVFSEGFTGCCRVGAGFFGLTKKDMISVLGAYADIPIQDAYGVRILLRRLLERGHKPRFFRTLYGFHAVD